MAPEADAPEGEDGPFSVGYALRLLEGLLFCCLGALLVFWVADRARDVAFEPITVTLCAAEACDAASPAPRDRPLTQLTALLDARGLVVFSPLNICQFAAHLLETRATEAGTEDALRLMQDRGTLTLERPDDATAIVSAGPRNDSRWDIARDALRPSGGRGCYPISYGRVFWPLLLTWALLVGWRLFRRAQGEWRRR